MYKDIITYKLAAGITEEHLLSIAQDIIDSWLNKQPGFIRWEINKNNDGGYTDIVYWKSHADAKRAEAGMGSIPNAGAWYACYENGSIVNAPVVEIGSFGG